MYVTRYELLQQSPSRLYSANDSAALPTQILRENPKQLKNPYNAPQ